MARSYTRTVAGGPAKLLISKSAIVLANHKVTGLLPVCRQYAQSLVFRFPQLRFRRARALVLVETMSRSSVVTVQKEKRRSRWRQECDTSNSVIPEGQYGGASP